MQKMMVSLKVLLLVITLSSIADLANGQNDPATATVINSFPYTVSNFNSAGGGSAAGMQGSCHTLACCSVKVFKVLVPSYGFLRADFSNFVPLAGSIIAYTANVANPTTWAHLTYWSGDAGNFCGYRDTLQMQRGYANRPYWYGNGPTDCFVPPTATINDALPPGEYYILVFNENQQAQQGVGSVTDLTFRFMPFCPQGYNCSSQTITNCLDNSYISPTGKVYTSSGSYRDTLLGAAVGGLDSLIFTSLTLNNETYVQDTIQDTTLCPTTDTLRVEATTNFVSYLELNKSDNDWVEVNGAVPSLINTNRSVFAWIKKSTTVSGSTQVIVGMNTSGSGNICNLQVGTNEQLGIYDGANSRYTGITVTDGQWHYVGYTYDEATNETKMYVDGLMAASYINSQSLTSSSNRISIGQEFDGVTTKSNFFDGILTEVAIWNEVLDSAEIAMAMHQAIDTTHPKYANLQAYYPMNKTCQSGNTIITDYSGKGNDGLASGADIQVGEAVLEQITGFNSAPHFNKRWKKDGNTINTSNNLELTTYTAGNYSLELYRNYFTITDDWSLTLSAGCVVASPYTYVDINATGANDGSSWANAYTDLQEAIDSAFAGDTILVAQGTYLPTEDTSGATTAGRTATFYINKDVIIRGGYPTGGGTQNPMMNPTILSGDLGTMGDASDNAYHVLWLEGLSSAAQIEGLHIQDGNANGTSFIDDWGAGIYNIGVGNGNSSNPTVQNCIVRWNNANYMGGGLLNNSSNGGETSPMIIGCLFYENTANVGGAIGNTTYNGGTNTMLVSNCTFADNTGTGASIYGRNGNANITVQNSILWDAKAIINHTANNEFMVSYSLVATNSLGAADAGNNLLTFQGQVFADAANDDYTLFASSLAIDNGSNGLVAAGYTTDLAGNNRVSNGIVDLGALEKLSIAMLYVNQAATGNNNGSSWADAYTDLQAALQQAGAGTEIWIASGTYTPTAGTDRSISFEIGSGVKVYGGFAGGETSLTQRNWSANTTILSGDIGVMSDATDNSYHVVTLKKGANTTLLDGLVIQEGNADGTAYVDDWGAGILNDGSGAGGMSSPTLMNCILRWNHANYLGGAILNNGGNGGETSPMIVGCLFYENTANTGGGAIGNITFKGGSNNMVITNSTFADNTGLGASLYNRNGNANVTVQNSILWDMNPIYNFANETTVQYSSVMGASLASGTIDGGNNQLATDPLFVDAANDDYSLQAISPAIASGNNAYLPAGYTMDLANNARQNGATVELGCYEDGASAARPDLAKAETASNTATAEQSMSIEEEIDGSNLISENAASMTVYPNPVQDIVHVNLKDVNQGATVRLLGATGQVLQQEEIQADAQTVVQLNMGRLAKGMYLLSVELEDGKQLNERVVKY